MNCPTCNAEMETGERFCGSCGYDLSSIPPERLVETPLATTADIQIICEQCGAALTRDKKFCGSCGQPLVLEPARPYYNVISDQEKGTVLWNAPIAAQT
jgi:predicted amidophosphoribosyltransferase